MNVVVDTNLIFSALLSASSAIRDTLLESGVRFYSPNFVFVELFKHKERIVKYGKLSELELLSYMGAILEKIHFVTTDFVSAESRQASYDLCHDVDVKDTPFVSLAIEMNAPLWSGDEKLKKGLLAKGFHKFYGEY